MVYSLPSPPTTPHHDDDKREVKSPSICPIPAVHYVWVWLSDTKRQNKGAEYCNKQSDGIILDSWKFSNVVFIFRVFLETGLSLTLTNEILTRLLTDCQDPLGNERRWQFRSLYLFIYLHTIRMFCVKLSIFQQIMEVNLRDQNHQVERFKENFCRN